MHRSWVNSMGEDKHYLPMQGIPLSRHIIAQHPRKFSPILDNPCHQPLFLLPLLQSACFRTSHYVHVYIWLPFCSIWYFWDSCMCLYRSITHSFLLLSILFIYLTKFAYPYFPFGGLWTKLVFMLFYRFFFVDMFLFLLGNNYWVISGCMFNFIIYY